MKDTFPLVLPLLLLGLVLCLTTPALASGEPDAPPPYHRE